MSVEQAAMQVFAENQELRRQLMQQVMANDAMKNPEDLSFNQLLAGQASKSKSKSSKGRKSSKGNKSRKSKGKGRKSKCGPNKKVKRVTNRICVYKKCRPGQVRDQKSKKCRKSKRKVTKKKSTAKK